MPMLPDDLPYDDWLKFVFDHPTPPEVSQQVKNDHADNLRDVTQKIQSGEVRAIDVLNQLRPPDWMEWYWHDDADEWNELANPARTVDYLTRAFRNIDIIAQDYSDAQMAQALDFLINNAASSHMFPLFDERVALQARLDCVMSFYDVFAKLFNAKCEPTMGHQSEGGNPLNNVCYMWWDIIPLFATGDEKPADADERYANAGYPITWESSQALDEPCLQVMEKMLQLDNMACLEGALHGLGHWKSIYPQRIETIIDTFLAARTDLSESIRAYASAARTGNIL